LKLRPSSPPTSIGRSKNLNGAGCRALPYLVDGLHPSKNLDFLTAASAHIAYESSAPEIYLYSPKMSERWEAWKIDADTSAAERVRRCEAMRQWWREHGKGYHQTWRVWSSRCKT